MSKFTWTLPYCLSEVQCLSLFGEMILRNLFTYVIVKTADLVSLYFTISADVSGAIPIIK